jgi:hypothetical protein
MSFLAQYFDLIEGKAEQQVLCPFPHVVPNSEQVYYESDPSAHVNLEKKTFHCKACGRGHSEASFITEILGCTYNTAVRLSRVFDDDNGETFEDWRIHELKDETRALLNSFTITDKVIDELNVRSASGSGLPCFPVFLYDFLVDIRRYEPGGDPKVMSCKDAMSGHIIPFDIWRQTPKSKVTVICAGEKDMAVARSHGFNAITITGGENAIPRYLKDFEGRKVVIVYDNDPAGIGGAIKLATELKKVAKSVKNCIAFHEICCNKGEDITDFFVKYGKAREDLINYLNQTPEFVEPTHADNPNYKVVSLYEASQPKYVNKMLRTNVQVVAVSEATFTVPSNILAEKMRVSGVDNDAMKLHEIREWNLTEDTVQDVLHLMDNNFKEETIADNIRGMLRILRKEKYVKITHTAKATVYKCYVTDMFETTASDVMPMEYTVYSLNTKLESGKKYFVTYKLVPHPYKGQQLTMLITHASQASDSISDFKVTPDTMTDLMKFQGEGTVAERITHIVSKFKGILGYDGNNTLITAMDLAYHTPLYFDLGQFKNERAYLDTLIVGESRMGKSSTAEAMRQTYGLGTFTSLAGNAATIPGLIGGSNKQNGSFQTRAGLIPQNHKGLIIFEELGKSNANLITELTDIRSSNEVRIARVSGTITLPATVRMVTLTNVKTIDGVIKPIASYPNGISILTELIGTAEDIARYDIALILGDKGAQTIDPFWTPEEPYPVEAYRARVRWVWSRTPSQIRISSEVSREIIGQANKLNETYGCHIKIFGTEAWKKLTRLAIAVAGYLVSTDDTFENIVVTQEHVEFAANFYRSIYDNGVFRLKEYAEHERKYSTIDEAGVGLLQDIYIKSSALLLHLEQTAGTTKNTLQAATGLSNDEYNAQINRLVSGMFVTFSRYEIVPTERFRMGMTRINRNTRALRVGEAQ